MKKLSLFSGIGGDDLASEWAGIETVCFVEIDKYCQKVLNKHWPEVPIIERVQDVTKERITEIMADSNRERQQQPEGIDQELWGRTIDRSETEEDSRCQYDEGQLLKRQYEKTPEKRTTVTPERPDSTPRNSGVALVSGGFPCQPHSVEGKRKGSTDERNLWPEFRRVIGEIRPRWVVAENVPGLFSSDAGRFFGEVVTDLAKMGYSVGWCTYGAVDVGALHRRNRVFIVAHAINGSSRGESGPTAETEVLQGINRETLCSGLSSRTSGKSCALANSTEPGLERAEPEGTAPAGGLPTQCGEMADTESTERQQPRDTRAWRAGLANGNPDVANAGEPISGWSTWTGRGQWEHEETLGNSGGGTGQADGIWAVEPDVGRVAHGIPSRVDRLKCLGNAVVPQQVYPIYKAIVEVEEML